MAPAEQSSILLNIAVVFSPKAGCVEEFSVSLPVGACVQDALQASGLPNSAYGKSFNFSTLPIGIWGRFVPLTQLLREGDRVEIYRPLLVDPKEARRQRYQRQKLKR